MAWDEAETGMDIPRYLALCDWWSVSPPPATQLARLTAYVGALLGVKPGNGASATATSSPQKAKPDPQDFGQFAQDASIVGMPVLRHRPNDPLLDLIPKKTQE